MTNTELIAKLQELPPDTVVLDYVQHHNCYAAVKYVDIDDYTTPSPSGLYNIIDSEMPDCEKIKGIRIY